MITFDFGIGISIGGIVGFFAGRYFDHFLAKRRNRESLKITEFNRAATEFRKSAEPVLQALAPPFKPLPSIDLGAFLYQHFEISFAAAVREFGYFIDDPKTKAAFLQSWYEYYCPDNDCNENCKPNFGKYSLRERTEEERQSIKNLARSRIEKILEFAKPR